MTTVTINSLVINNSAAKSGAQFGPFYNSFNSITSIDFGQVPWTNKSMYRACYDCYTLSAVSNLNENITNMRATFSCWAANDQFGCKLEEPPTIPNSVIDMGYTFYGCFKLKNTPVIPPNVTSLDYTFYYCKNITAAPVIPNKVSTMSYAFSSCYNLASAPIIPNSVTRMTGTFGYCYDLTSAPIIPNPVGFLDSTFVGCNNLSSDIYIYSTCINNAINCFYDTTAAKNVYVPFNAALEIYTPTYNAFVNAGYTTSSIQHGVTLKECPNFENYNNWWICNYDGFIYNYITDIIPTTLSFPNNINGKSTSFIGVNAFYGGSSATMANGRNIQTFEFNNATILGNSVGNMFMYCTALNTVSNLIFPDNITDYQRVFMHCAELTSVPALSNTAVDLYEAFEYCNKLITAPIIPNSVTRMYGTFGYCNALMGNIYIYSNQITEASYCFSNFGAVPIKNVYIPFFYEDGRHTKTYNAFIAAGYKTDGSVANVYLKDLATL